MKILTFGHRYELANFEKPEAPGQVLQFIEKQPDPEKGNGALTTINDGTTNEDVLAVLIDHIGYLNVKFPCRENAIVITKLEEALLWLNHRTAQRKNRGIEGKALA